MRNIRIQWLEDLVIHKGLVFTGGFKDGSTFELLKGDKVGLRYTYPSLEGTKEMLISSDDFKAISFGYRYLTIEFEKSEDTTVSATLECPFEEYMNIMVNDGYYTHNALSVLTDMVKQGETFKISKYHNREASFYDRSIIELRDGKLFLKYAKLREKAIDEKEGFFIDEVRELIIIDNVIHIDVHWCGSFIFERSK